MISNRFLSKPFTWVTGLAIATCVSVTMAVPALAQELLREGKLQFVMLEEMSNDANVLSQGQLSALETDPNFTDSYTLVYDDAFAILDGYTPVTRGGYFPENVGIPREQQVTVDEAVYRLYRLEEGTELMLYRSPMEGTSRYFIREN
ncbi:MAG: hypothetical protein WBA57_24770 [Elainellaceae cyanobacterium]